MTPDTTTESRCRETAETWRRWGDAGLRLLAAVPVGYAVASLWAMALARLLPMNAAEATVTATLFAFIICAVAAMWAYAAPSGWRAFWTLAVAGVLAGTITWLSLKATGRL